MAGLAVEISNNVGEKREWRPCDYGMANAFAKIIRREFPELGIQGAVARRFGVEPGEAKGLIYGTASKRTLDRIMRNPRNFGIWLECLCDVSGVSLEQYIEEQAREAEDDRKRAEAKERHLESLEARWRARASNDSGHAR